MGIGGKDGGAVPPKEDMEQFLELRRHVKRMQAGTPLLLKTTGDSGQEQLQICTFSVSQDLQTLRWQDQEGSGTVHEVPMSAVVEVSEDSNTSSSTLAGRKGEDSHHGLTLTLRKGERNASTEMGLICASPEDLVSWREGLKFLIVAQPGPIAPPPAASTAPRAAKASAPAAAGSAANSSKAVVSGAEEDLRRKLAQEREANEKLRQENEMLQETLKRKDAAINGLMRDAQGQALKDRPIKTESTSRESDLNLHEREVAILQRKNQRLRKALKAKQQTVTELLKLVGKVSAQQGLESSAVEDVDEDDDEEANSDSAGLASSARGADAVVKVLRKPPSAPAKPDSSAALAAVGAGEGDGAASDEGVGDDDDDDSEPEAVKEEMRQLTGKLERLERDVDGLRAFEPPPRGGAATAAMAMPTSSTPTSGVAGGSAGSRSTQPRPVQPPGASGLAELLAGGLLDGGTGGGLPRGGAAQLLQALLEGAAAASNAGTAPAAATGPAAAMAPAAATAPAAAVPAAATRVSPAGAGATGAPKCQGSTAALQALERELESLEEKKRVVERLARQLEPPSDNEEEDDGFPLR